MKKIALSALLVLSSAAFAGGRNASGPQNPPQPPTPEEQVAKGICHDFYEWHYPGLNRAEAQLPETDTIVTIVPNTTLQVVANVGCVLAGPLVVMENLCHWARKHGVSCVNDPHELQWTRPYP